MLSLSGASTPNAERGFDGQQPPYAAPQADAWTTYKLRLAILARCLTDLSDRERDVIGLRFIARLHNREIAPLVSTSDGNVAKILHRALRKLRDRLIAEGYTTSDGPEGVSE